MQKVCYTQCFYYCVLETYAHSIHIDYTWCTHEYTQLLITEGLEALYYCGKMVTLTSAT